MVALAVRSWSPALSSRVALEIVQFMITITITFQPSAENEIVE